MVRDYPNFGGDLTSKEIKISYLSPKHDNRYI